MACSCCRINRIDDLPFNVIHKITTSLDTDKKSWEGLAAEANYSFDQISLLELEYIRPHGSPTRCLLRDLSSMNISVEDLYYKFKAIKREREMELLTPYLKKKCTCLKNTDITPSHGAQCFYQAASTLSTLEKNKTNPDEKSEMRDKDVNFNKQKDFGVKDMEKNLKQLEISDRKQEKPVFRPPQNRKAEPVLTPVSSLSSSENSMTGPRHDGLIKSKPGPTDSSSSNSSNHSCTSQTDMQQQVNDSIKSIQNFKCDDVDTALALLGTTNFTYKELSQATNGFSDSCKIGEGAFGSVFHGRIRKTDCAIKRLFKQPGSEDSGSFKTHMANEIKSLLRYRHENLVLLYGYNIENTDVCLVYQYMVNGSVEDRLQCKSDTDPLTWDIRISIACGAARGLQYLHTMNPEKPLIHGDIKSANILLDKHMEAKIGDLGLAQHATATSSTTKPNMLTHITRKNMDTKVYGTQAYLPPEFMASGRQSSTKTDTFSFGVVLFEMCTGLKAFDETRVPTDERFLYYHMLTLTDDLKEKEWKGSFESVRDKKCEDCPDWSLIRLLQLALKCTEQKKKDRPPMPEVYERLDLLEKEWCAWKKDQMISSSKTYGASCEQQSGYNKTASSESQGLMAGNDKDLKKSTPPCGIASSSLRCGSPMESIPYLLQRQHDNRQELQVDCDDDTYEPVNVMGQESKSDNEHVYENVVIDSYNMTEDEYESNPKKIAEIEETNDRFNSAVEKLKNDPNSVKHNLVPVEDSYYSDPSKLEKIKRFDAEMNADNEVHQTEDSLNDNEDNSGTLTGNMRKLEATLEDGHINQPVENIDISDCSCEISSNEYVSAITYAMGSEEYNTVVPGRESQQKMAAYMSMKMTAYMSMDEHFYDAECQGEHLTSDCNSKQYNDQPLDADDHGVVKDRK